MVRAADMGCAESQYRYGLMCYLGEGGDVDYSDAFHYLLTAANSGHPEALWRVGVLLYAKEFADFGWKRDPEKARAFIFKAAEAGAIEAYEQLAILFRDGIGGEKNVVRTHALAHAHAPAHTHRHALGHERLSDPPAEADRTCACAVVWCSPLRIARRDAV
jgi:TPR repeat protein